MQWKKNLSYSNEWKTNVTSDVIDCTNARSKKDVLCETFNLFPENILVLFFYLDTIKGFQIKL